MNAAKKIRNNGEQIIRLSNMSKGIKKRVTRRDPEQVTRRLLSGGGNRPVVHTEDKETSEKPSKRIGGKGSG